MACHLLPATLVGIVRIRNIEVFNGTFTRYLPGEHLKNPVKTGFITSFRNLPVHVWGDIRNDVSQVQQVGPSSIEPVGASDHLAQ